MSPAVLAVRGLVAGYGKKDILHGVTVDIIEKEIVAVIGHNGAGKSTLLKAIFGMIPVSEGRIIFNDEAVQNASPRWWLNHGVSYAPQGNRVFADLSVKENLQVAALALPDRSEGRSRFDWAVEEFPALKPRLRQRAGTLSGGEKQILALAMALMTKPTLMLLDEPSLGLAPPLVQDALARVAHLRDQQGVSILIVEQKVREVLKIANRAYVLRNGIVSFSGEADELKEEQKLRQHYL